MKRIATAAAAAAGVLALAGPAAAQPQGQGLEQVQAVCNGTETLVTTSAGASFWVEGTHYLLTEFTATFTPVDGEPETFTKTYGNRTGVTGDAIECTGSVTEEEGTFEFFASGVAVD